MKQEWFVDAKSGVRIPSGLLRIPVDRLIVAFWNPNKQDPGTFKNLVASIKDNGFIDIPQVAPLDTPELRAEYLDASHDAGEYWLIIGGAHRYDAGRMLDMAVIPVIIVSDWSSDMMKMQNMRLNALKGRIDPDKFYKLYTELKEKGYADEMLKTQMGLVQQNAMKKLLKGVRAELPKEVRRAFDEQEEEINTPDDLGRVLKELFSKHGDTLPFGYMVFEYAAKTNYWIRMEKEVKLAMDEIARFCYDEKISVDEVFAALFTNKKAVKDSLDEARKHSTKNDGMFE